MAIKWIDPTDFERDGTSQRGRSLAALSPGYVVVDERTTEDFVEFAREYGKTLDYFDVANETVPKGNFGDFIGSLPAEQVAAFLKDPAAFDPDQYPALFRPHFTLFAVFLRLLQNAQNNLNAFTQRHLDYHFRRFLQMQPRPAEPDRVNLVFSLADRESHTLVPVGTLVSAGVDALGKDRMYKTTTNLVVNRAQIERVSSVFVEREIVGVADSWHRHDNRAKDGRFEMLRIAHGRPRPGDPLPIFKSTPLDTASALDTQLLSLKSLVKSSQTQLGLSLAELRQFMLLLEPDDEAIITANRKEKYNATIRGRIAAKRLYPEQQVPPGDPIFPPATARFGWKPVDFPFPAGTSSQAVVGMSGTADGSAFALQRFARGSSEHGQVLLWNGVDWQSVGSELSMHSNAIWAHGPTHIFVVGNGGKRMHWDGASWADMSLPDSTATDLTDVWGSGPNDVFVVATDGAILHYDGFSWTTQSSETNSLAAVWGTGPKDVFAVGKAGTILHYDGIKWKSMASSVSRDLLGVWGSGPQDVFAVGKAGTMVHYDGVEWTSMTSSVSQDLIGVWGSGPKDVFAVAHDGTTLHDDGTSWTNAGTSMKPGLSRFVGALGWSSLFARDAQGQMFHYCAIDLEPPPADALQRYQDALQQHWDALCDVETYFAMPIESFEQLVDRILVEGNAWNAGYYKDGAFVAALLDHAHHDKLRTERRAALLGLFDATKAIVHNPPKSIAAQTLDAYSAILEEAVVGNVEVPKGSAFIPDFEDGLHRYLTDSDVEKLHDAAVAEEWDTVLDLLAHAMTLRIGKAPPRKISWRNIHPAVNARTVLAKRSKADADGHRPFATFGAAQSESDLSTVLGFALTSPILELSSGTRTVTLTLGLRAEGFDFDELQKVFAADFTDVDAEGRNLSPLAIEVSTAKGWLRVKPDKALSKIDKYDELSGLSTSTSGPQSIWNDHADAQGLHLVFTLAEDDPAVAPLPHPPDGMDARYPAVRILMQPVWNETALRYLTYYRELTSLFVGAVHIKVTVSGLLPTAIESDESILDPKKPFEPFGSLPSVGSRFSFGHPEIVTKKIDRLKCDIQWSGKPDDLATHYTNYGITPTFTAKVHWSDITGTEQISASNDLFAPSAFDMQIAAPMGNDHAAVTKNSFAGRVKTWRRYVQWELKAPDFQHGVYASKAAEMAMKLSIDLAKNPASVSNVGAYQVKPPYTPKLASLKLGYDSSVEILLFPKAAGDRMDRIYHVHPFGVAELRAEDMSDELPFLPRYDAESALCIGLSSVALPETVTLLFRLDEGSADRDIEAPVVQWSQLSGNRWIPLGNRVLRDETLGLQRSGVVALSLEKAEPSTMMPAHLTWVRASISQDHASICDTRALHTQAVLATFDDRGNAPEHYRAPLPAATITRLKSPVAGIVGLAQPDPSFGGRPAEDGRMFSTRVSERLRHKQRALSTWDYERIVLDGFPQIFKAKCIPMPENEPGRVDVLVIPDVRALPTNELGPKAPIAMLSEIEAHLRARVPACARVNVRNATFRAVRLRLGVRFTEVGNDAYWMGRLNEELNRFLSPWAFDEGADIALGGRMYASSIVDFVDRCDYVDYMAGVSLFFTDDEGDQFVFLIPPGVGGGPYFVGADGPDRVLVAYPQHRIDVITTEHYDERLYRGISYMEVGMDFVVG